ncbi:MAG: FtsX-like permease family protein [Flammeovirgaceae bacterium]|nr:FtsX-like permease family protein [Flammeovirgaceae bacterium]MDW8286853.1 FtsX-like permease family protein [Flammeovirgaceae bacterium]
MNLFQISWKHLQFKSLSSILNITLFALGVAIISFITLVSGQLEATLERNQGGIGMVVGAKGSPLQLVLCAIFHIDFPTGNIKIKDAAFLSKHPLIAQVIPQALGDSYRNFRIVGTNHAYAKLYQVRVEKGDFWKHDFEVCIGKKVALETGLSVGDTFVSSHGLSDENEAAHHHRHFKVVGIFESSGTVIDQLILTSVQSIWEVHQHHHDEEHHHHHDNESIFVEKYFEQEITTVLVKFRNPMGAIQLPRFINETTNMQAANPAFEIARLFSLLGVGVTTLNILAYVIMVVSGMSVAISLYNSLKEQKYELAYLRVIGAKRWQLLSIIVWEGVLLALLGYGVGIFLSRAILWVVSQIFSAQFHQEFAIFVFGVEEFFLWIGTIGIGFLAALVPALQVIRTDISKTLAEN